MGLTVVVMVPSFWLVPPFSQVKDTPTLPNVSEKPTRNYKINRVVDTNVSFW